MGDLQIGTLYRGLRYSESLFYGVDAVPARTVSNRTYIARFTLYRASLY